MSITIGGRYPLDPNVPLAIDLWVFVLRDLQVLARGEDRTINRIASACFQLGQLKTLDQPLSNTLYPLVAAEAWDDLLSLLPNIERVLGVLRAAVAEVR